MTMRTLKRVKRKAISVIMTGALVAAMLTGCGNSSGDAGSTSSGAGSSSESGSTATDLSKVELTVGTSGTYAPFSYFKEDGKTLQGFDVEFLKALQDKLGFKIKDDTIQNMDYGPLTTSLGQGQLDLGAAALCATDERKEVMNFSDTYYDAGIIVAVGKDNNDIKSVDDLADGKYKVAVQTGTIAYEYATSKLPEKCLQSFDSQALAYKAVEGGQADATIYDAPGTSYSIKTGEVKLKIVGDEFYNGQAPYALAFSFDICKKYPDIIEQFNAAIKELEDDGTIDKLKKDWCE